MRPTGIRAAQALVRCTAIAVVAVGALTACGAESQQPRTSLPSASSSSTESTPVLPPLGPADLPMPAEARVQNEAGVEAFVRYYIELINRASRTLDAAPLREFSEGCADCDRIATDFENDKAAGHRYRGGEITITSYEYVTIGTQQGASFVIDSSPLTIVDRDGRPVDGLTFPATTGLASAAEVRWDDSRSSWTMAQLLLGQA